MGAGASAPVAHDAATPRTAHAKKKSKKTPSKRTSREALAVEILSTELARAYASVARAKADVRTAERDGALSYTECVLCIDKEIDTVFLPCGHACACRSCATRLYDAHVQKGDRGSVACPVCRKDVAYMHRIFVPRAEGARKVGARPVMPDLSATWG